MKGDFYNINAGPLLEEAKRLIPIFQEILNEKGEDTLVESAFNYVDEILEKAGLKEKATCNGKCSFCCHSTIFMSELEKNYIRKRLKEHKIKPNKQRSKLQNNKSEDQLKWVERACPYLSSTDGKGECTIYPIRPLVCRTHNSFEDSKFCNKEEFPGRSIEEGRVVNAEAVLLALSIISSGELKLVPIHKVIF